MNSFTVLASISPKKRTTMLGDDDASSFNWGSLFSATGELVNKGIAYKKQKDTAEQATKKSASDLAASIAADQFATDMTAKAACAAALKLSSADADKAMAEQAVAAQDSAAAGLSDDNQKKRADAARKALQEATAQWQKVSAGGDAAATTTAKCRVMAAQMTYAKTQNQQLVSKGRMPDFGKGGGESWWTRKVLGPVPGWGVVLGSVAIAGGIGLTIWKLRS